MLVGDDRAKRRAQRYGSFCAYETFSVHDQA